MSYSTIQVKVINKIAKECVAHQEFLMSTFLSNCGYRIFSAATHLIYNKRVRDEESVQKLVHTHIYNWLLDNYNHVSGVRKIVMSGSFSAIGGRHKEKLGNGTALFMLNQDIPLVGEETVGKESGVHYIQMGELVMLPEMERHKPPKLISKLYDVQISKGGGW